MTGFSGFAGQEKSISKRRGRTVYYFIGGLAAIAWAVFSVVTGRGYYRGCPPGGFDPKTNPFCFWAPTITIFICGVILTRLSLCEVF